MRLLPQWLEDVLPVPIAPYRIRYRGTFEVLNSDGDPVLVTDDLDYAYDTAHEIAGEADVVLDRSLDHPDVSGLGFSVWDTEDDEVIGMVGPDGPDGTMRVYFSNSQDHRRRLLVDDYRESVNAQQRYEEDAHDVMNAYEFLNTHPAFWVRASTHDLLSWVTDNAVAGFIVMVSRSEDSPSGVLVEIEGGDHTDDYLGTGVNLALTVSEPSWEQAIVAFARNVARDYHGDGTMRDGSMDRAREALRGSLPEGVFDRIDSED